MTTLAVIPARLEASRLPRKPLRLLGGEPLIVRVWERVRALGVTDLVVVATDSDEVAAVARDAGATAVLTRADHPSGTDRVAEVVARAEYAAVTAVLNVQGDEPFVSGEAAHAALGLVTSGHFSLATVAVPAPAAVRDRPDVVKVVTADDGRALYFSRSGVPYVRDADDRELGQRLLLRHLGLYAYTPEALARWVALPEHPLERCERLEQLRPLAAGMALGVAIVSDAPESGIDTADDLALANARWADLHAGRS